MGHHVPQHVRQGEPAHIEPDEGAHGGGEQSVPEIVAADLPSAVAQGLQGADLHPLLVDHALEGGHHDEGGHGEGQHGEDIGHAPEHDGVASGHGDVFVGSGGDHQGRGDGRLDGVAHGRLVPSRLQLHQHVGIGQIIEGPVGQEHEPVMLRVGHGLLAGDGVFGGKDQAPDAEGDLLAVHGHGEGVPHGEVVGVGELLLQKAALYIGGLEHGPGAQVGGADAERALIDLQRHLHVLPQPFRLHRQRGPALGVGHPRGVSDPVQVLGGEARRVDPEVRQIALGKVGLHRQVHEPPGAVQARKDPGAQKAQQDHGDELHGVLPHVPEKLFGQGPSPLRGSVGDGLSHHWMSSTRMGC